MSVEDDARKVEEALRALHALISSGKGDDASADALRDVIVDAMGKLPPEERRRLNDLSGDLYEASAGGGVGDEDESPDGTGGTLGRR